MSKTVQWKRGNANVSSTYTGPEGELTVNTTNWTLNIHDGVTQGGHPASFSLGNLDVSNQTIFGTVSNANIVIDPSGTGIVVLNNGVATDGNITAPYFLGNGSLLTGIQAGSNYGNANVAAYLPSYTGNLSAGNLSITNTFLITANSANNFSTMTTVANNDARISATNGVLNSTIYLWANNGRMSFNTVSNAFDFNFNGQLSATDFIASKSSATGYSFYTPGEGLAGFTHVNGPPSYIRIVHDGIEYTKFYANYTTQTIGNLVISSNANVFGTFPNAFVQVYANINSYSQVVHQNLNSGPRASSDFVATANNGDDFTYFVGMGISSNTYNFPGFGVIKPNDAYLLAVGNNASGPSIGNVGNLVIGSTNGNIKFFVGAAEDANVITQINSTGLLPGANVTYNLGSSTRQWKDLWLSNSTMYLGGFPVTVSNTGVLSVNGSPISGSYSNANVASYLPTYTGNIAGNISKNGNVWIFGTNGTTTFPTNISIDYSGNNVQFPRIIADTGKAFSVQGQGNIGSAALAWTVDPNAASQYAAVSVSRAGGDNLAKVVLQAQSDSGDVATAKTWQFNQTGTTRFPGDTILAPAGTSITMQSDQYSQLYWQNANVTVAPNMAINSNFYVAQNNATLDIVYRDGNSTQQQKSWLWGVDGTLTLPTAGRINFDYLSISSDANVSAFYAPAGNVQFAAGTGNAQIVANSLNDSKTWIFGTDGNLALPHSGVLLVSGGITAGPTIASPAPYLSGFSSISAVSMSASGNISSGNMSTGVITLTNGAVIKDNAGDSVAFGQSAGATSQGNSAVAIGHNAGVTSQGTFTVAIGRNAGQTSQGGSAVAVGVSAGDVSQGVQAVAVGNGAGGTNQGNSAVAIGVSAGQSTQSVEAVAIGNSAGSLTQGISAIAIGKGAGRYFQGNNSIIINATGADLDQTTANTFTVAPVRNDVANVAEILFYNITSKEVTYGNTISVAGNISAGNVNITGNIVDTGALSIITGSNGNIALNPNGTGIVTVSNALTVAGNITGNTGGFAIGYRDIPQVVFTSNATLALTDAGKHYFSSNSANVITVPNNTTVSFSIGTAISIIQQGTANLTVTPGSGVTMYLAGNSTSSSRTVGNYGMATLMKVGTDTWFINGTGVN
jgi:hypothetical protein